MPEIGRDRRQNSGSACWLEKLAIVVGNSSSDEAKIGGMTPEVLSLSGRNDVCPS